VTFPTKSEWGGLLSSQQVDQLYQRIPQYAFDMTQARQELAASSVPHGFSDTISYPNSGPQIGQALLTLSQNLKQIGIQLAVKEITLEQWIAGLGNHQLGIYTGWYFAVTGDPAEYAQQLLNGANAGPQGTNIAQYQNAAVTKALDESQRSSGSARGQLIGQALVQAGADVPYQPLWWGEGATAFGPHVRASSYGPYFFVGPWATQVHPA
jgi:peptide/nickel transport system substrate-binding protein